MSIHSSVIFGTNVEVGEYAVIEMGVRIGDRVTIGAHAVIKEGTVIGDDVEVGDHVVLGKRPGSNKKMARKPATELPPLAIDNEVVIGSHVTLYRGLSLAEGVFIGDHVSIREQIFIDRHTIIGRHAMIEPNTRIGKNVTIQTGCYVTADTIIEDQVFIGPCCSMSNDKYMASGKGTHTGPHIKAHAKIGNHATLLPAIVIGEHAVVGAGAVVTKDVPEKAVTMGNPARVKS